MTLQPCIGGVISQKHLDKIAREFLTDWEELSSSLGLTEQQEHSIHKTNREYADQKREAVRTWKRNKGNGATYGAFIAAAEEISNMQLADNVRSLLKGMPALIRLEESSDSLSLPPTTNSTFKEESFAHIPSTSTPLLISPLWYMS